MGRSAASLTRTWDPSAGGPVSSRTARRLAWGIGALCLAGTVAGLVLSGLSGTLNWQFAEFAGAGGALVAYPVVGALVAARQPRNPVGWQLLVVSGFLTLTVSGDAYAGYALATAPGSLPGGLLVAWLAGVSFAPMIWALLMLLPLYFPTGRLLSSRWRLVAWAGAAFMVLAIVGNGLLPDAIEVSGIGVVRNPFAVPAATPVLNLLIDLSAVFLLLGIGGAVAAVVVRFRRARGVERAQLKWFTYAVALTPLPFIAYEAIPGLANLLLVVILPLVPVSIGIAILRYRLYDIDRLINRTLVYATLTAMLGGGYLGVVLLLRELFGRFTGRTNLAVAGSTLAVAALFQPARRRIQQAVDRRFNRRRYHAATMIAAFSARLRDEIDLNTLSAELLAVVDQAMEPTRVSLWLRPATRASQDHDDSVAHRPAFRPTGASRSGRRDS
jgi:hypothetical protein